MDNHRRAIKDNDLKKVDYVDFRRKNQEENILDIGFETIDFEKIKENDYNLVGSFYKEVESSNKYDFELFGNLIEKGLIIGKKGKIITKNAILEGNIPVIAGGKSSPYFHNQSNYKGNIITISASGSAGFIWYHNYPIWASDCSVVFSNNEPLLNTKYLYYVLKSQQENIYSKQHGTSQPHVYLKDLSQIQILLPSLEIQQKLVAELDTYQKIIAGAEQIVENYKPHFEIDEEREVEKLSDICKIRPTNQF